MSDTDLMREIAWISLETEPPEPEGKTMTDAQWEREIELAAAGEWEALGLDALPDGWRPASIEELRHAE